MLAKTHIAFGLLTGLILLPYIHPSNSYIFIALIAIASILPDIDCPRSKISNKIPIIPRIISIFFKHRGMFHSIFFAFLIPYAVYYFNPGYGIATFIGYTSHLLIDALTEEGINFLNPITNFRISGFIQTGTISELVIFLLIVSLIFLQLL